MEQGGGMNVFNSTPMLNNGIVGFAPAKFGTQKDEHGADAFAPTTHHIGADSWNEGNI